MATDAIINREWGVYVDHFRSNTLVYKQLRLNPESNTSMQRHKHRTEVWKIIFGSGTVVINNTEHRVQVGDVYSVNPYEWHQIKSEELGLIIDEVQFGVNCRENDIERK